MKKKLSILITLILSFMFCVCGLFACGGLEGDSGEGDNIIQEEQVDWTTIYKVQGSVITGLTSYGSSLNELTIPSKINGISITAIGDWAFGEGQFEKVIISEGIMVIQANAFRECRKLNTIILAESITSIGDTAFGCCYALRNIRIPKNVTHIAECAFWNCTNLNSVVIGSKVSIIKADAFDACENLRDVFYEGKSFNWASITIQEGNDCLKDAKIYYYSEKSPTSAGNFWYYTDGKATKW